MMPVDRYFKTSMSSNSLSCYDAEANARPSMMPLVALTAVPAAEGESVADEQSAPGSISCDIFKSGSAVDSGQPTTESAATPLDETAGPTETTSAETDGVTEETIPAAAAPNAEDAAPADRSRELPLGEEETPVVEAAATPVETGRSEDAEAADVIVADEIEADIREDAKPEVEVVVVAEDERDARAGEYPSGICVRRGTTVV